MKTFPAFLLTLAIFPGPGTSAEPEKDWAQVVTFQLESGEIDKAEKTLKKWLQKNKGDEAARELMAELNRRREDYPSALRIYEDLLRQPLPAARKAGLLFKTGEVCREMGETERAIGAFEASLAGDPRNPRVSEIHLILGMLYLNGRHDKTSAIREFRLYLQQAKKTAGLQDLVDRLEGEMTPEEEY